MLGTSIANAWSSLRPNDRLTVLRRQDVDLRDPVATRRSIDALRPDVVIHAAAHVGGIADKTARPVPYLLNNVQIDSSVISGCMDADVRRLVYIASAAIYPADSRSPIAETALLTGALEEANEGYGIAKIAGVKTVEYAARQTGYAYRALAPSNLYGPADTFDPVRAHLIASTLRKSHEAKLSGLRHVEVWGDGTARREFTYAPDVAAWLVTSVDASEAWPALMNIGAGEDHSIRRYYELAAEVVGWEGELRFDPTKPSGVPRRLIDSSHAREFGWAPSTGIRDGMAKSYRAFLARSTPGSHPSPHTAPQHDPSDRNGEPA